MTIPLSILLTQRQRQAFALRLSGLTAAEIACEMGIAETTVKVHLQRAYTALDLHGERTRNGLWPACIRRGWLRWHGPQLLTPHYADSEDTG